MPEMLHTPTSDWSTDIEPGDRLYVRERLLGIDAGQELEVVDVSEETVAGGYPERVALRLHERETPSAAPGVFEEAGQDLRHAVERGKLEAA